MDARIRTIDPDSIAEDLGLAPGTRVLAVNTNRALEDLFDWEFEVLNAEELELEVEHPDGSLEIFEIEKDLGEDLGIHFESPVFTPIKTCNNACPFCFIDQQPQGLRPTLYVKDDDYRLSYFCNTYVTLTNLTHRDRERIARIKPGPLYVSVHSTVPHIRVELLKNAKAGEILTELAWLASLDVPFHAQLVICPGINDGESLTQSLQDLAKLRPYCLSAAIVPLGLTAYRDHLPSLTPVDKACAQDVLARLDAFIADSGLAEFAFASDEFYVRAEVPIPGYETYGEFPQLDDGVGTARLLTEEFFELAPRFPQTISPRKNLMIVTGKLGEMVLSPLVQRFNQIEGLYVDLVGVQNKFWGDAVTVTGLITGQDLKATLAPMDLSGYTEILLPETMLKNGEPIFLDDLSVADLAQALGVPITVVANPTEATSLVTAVLGPPAEDGDPLPNLFI